MRWDTYSDAKIEEMIRLAAIAVGVDVSSDEAIGCSSSVTEPRFQLDLGVVPILWNIVDRVRTPHLRRSALRMLKNAPLQEGVWNAALSSLVAERTIELEEAGLERVEFKEDIPKEQRVRFVLVYMEPGDNKATACCHMHDQEIQTTIAW